MPRQPERPRPVTAGGTVVALRAAAAEALDRIRGAEAPRGPAGPWAPTAADARAVAAEARAVAAEARVVAAEAQAQEAVAPPSAAQLLTALGDMGRDQASIVVTRLKALHRL